MPRPEPWPISRDESRPFLGVEETDGVKEWTLSQAGFDKLLFLLDQDRERAAEKYKQLYGKLCRFAEWKGSRAPEEHTEETLDRVCRKLEAGEQIEDIIKYSNAVQHFVVRESFKQPLMEELDDAVSFKLKAPDSWRDDPHQVCLDRCLNELPGEDKKLIVAYYENDKRAKIDNRKQLAIELGISRHYLEVRASRIREKLLACILKCLKRQ